MNKLLYISTAAALIAGCQTFSPETQDKIRRTIVSGCHGLALADQAFDAAVANGLVTKASLIAKEDQAMLTVATICANPPAVTDPVSAATAVALATIAVVGAIREAHVVEQEALVNP